MDGKTKEWTEKMATNERKSAVLSAIEKISEGKRIAIVGHDSPDVDFFGNATAWVYFLEKVAGVKADVFAVTEGDAVLQNEVIAKFLGVEFKDQKFLGENSDLYELKLFIDTNGSNSSLSNIKPDFVFDHHKGSEVPIENCFTIYEDVGASCTMAYVFLGKGLGMKFSQEILTGLALGIALDTRSLQDEGAKEVDTLIHKEILSQLNDEYYKLYFHYCYYPPILFSSIKRKGRAFSSAESQNGVVFAFLGETEVSEDNSYGIIADELIRTKGAEIAVVAGIRGGESEKVAVRVRSESLGFAKILKECFKIDFYSNESGVSSGGRSTSAGGALIPLTSFEKGQCKNKEKKEHFLKDKKTQRIGDLQRFVASRSTN